MFACNATPATDNFNGESYESRISKLELLYYIMKHPDEQVTVGDKLVFLSDTTCTFSTCSSKAHLCNYYIKGDNIIISPQDGISRGLIPDTVKISGKDKLIGIMPYRGKTFIRVFHKIKD